MCRCVDVKCVYVEMWSWRDVDVEMCLCESVEMSRCGDVELCRCVDV